MTIWLTVAVDPDLQSEHFFAFHSEKIKSEKKIADFIRSFSDIVWRIFGPIEIVQITGALIDLKQIEGDFLFCEKILNRKRAVFRSFLEKRGFEVKFHFDLSHELGPRLACIRRMKELCEGLESKEKKEEIRDLQWREFQKHSLEKPPEQDELHLHEKGALHPRLSLEIEELRRARRDWEELRTILEPKERSPLKKRPRKEPVNENPEDYFT